MPAGSLGALYSEVERQTGIKGNRRHEPDGRCKECAFYRQRVYRDWEVCAAFGKWLTYFPAKKQRCTKFEPLKGTPS